MVLHWVVISNKCLILGHFAKFKFLKVKNHILCFLGPLGLLGGLVKFQIPLWKYTNPAYGHSGLLQAKVVGPSSGANEPRSTLQTMIAGLKQLSFSKCCTIARYFVQCSVALRNVLEHCAMYNYSSVKSEC